MYGYLKQRIKHAVRFRHKRGYGVHSPFMFNLILNVIRDKERQFSYPEAIERSDRLRLREKKTFRLLSRLVRYLSSKNVLCLGTKAPVLATYLQCVSRDVAVICNEPDQLAVADFIYVGHDANAFLLNNSFFSATSLAEDHCVRCIVIADIYRAGFNMQLWRQLKVKANVSVDMMWYGILFFDDRLQRGSYNLII